MFLACAAASTASCAAWVNPSSTSLPARFCAQLKGAGPLSDALDPDASGFAELEVRRDAIHFTVRVLDIGKVVATHVHRGSQGENGPMVYELNPGFTGDYLTGIARKVPENLTADLLRNSPAYYVKLHSLKFPGGAIRGQLGPCASGERLPR